LLPAQLTIPAGATSAAFSATALTVHSDEIATITASLGGIVKTAMVTIMASSSPGQRLFYLAGEPSELPDGALNRARVAPSVAPPDLTGTIVTAGSGAVLFKPARIGNGVAFSGVGTQNQNAAYFRFTGSGIEKLFKNGKGEISFYLKSAYTFAERQRLPVPNARCVFSVIDQSAPRYLMLVLPIAGRLSLVYQVDGAVPQVYALPVGLEDVTFGKDVILKVRLSWDGATQRLYLNDTLAQSLSYAPNPVGWSAGSFTFGALGSTHPLAGLYASDDVIDEFELRVPAAGK
jgi:hypothetical protein